MPNYTKKIVYLSEAQYQELIANQTITVDGTTVTYDENTIYMTPQNTPLYAQDLGAWAKTSTKPTYTATEVGAISTSAKGANNGVAELDANGKVPSSQLPSYVDDVLEYNSSSNFPATGETGKIYIDLSDNTTYRWSGSTYVAIGSSLALGTTSSTAFRGDYGNAAYQHASAKGSEFSSGLYKIATNAEGHVTAATAVAKTDITALGIPAQDTTYTFDGTYNASTNKAATVQTVTNAIGALDGGTIGTGGTGKTITSLTQTDGNVSATFTDISITKSQVSDLGTIGAAAAKGVDTSITAGSTSTNLPTSGAVASFVAGQQKRGNAAVFVGTCSTAAGTAAKVVTCPDYDQLVVGDIIYVTFANRNTAPVASLMMNVNSTGDKSIKRFSGSGVADLYQSIDLSIGSPIKFVYDGTYWKVLSESRVKAWTNNGNDSVCRPLLFALDETNRNGFGESEVTIGKRTTDLYIQYGKLFMRNSQVMTADSVNDYVNPPLAVEKEEHDQYLYNLQTNQYRAVLRIFLVTPNGNMLKKRQASADSILFGSGRYSISIKGYDASNNVVTTWCADEVLSWSPTESQGWYTLDTGIFSTPYWIERTFAFTASQLDGVDHVAVSFSGLDSTLSMYDANQNLNFSCNLTKNTVEIKNVALVYTNYTRSDNGGYLTTGFRLPEQTVYNPQNVSSSVLIRGYKYSYYYINVPGFDDGMETCSMESEIYRSNKIDNKFIIRDGFVRFTTGYFEVPMIGAWQGGSY